MPYLQFTRTDVVAARRAKKLRKRYEGAEDEEEEIEPEKVEDELVDDLMTSKTTYWSQFNFSQCFLL